MLEVDHFRMLNTFYTRSEHAIERFSYDLEMKTREQNRKNKRTEIEPFDWFVERTQMRVAFGWLSERSAEKNFMSEELFRNQSILCLDVILQHDWPIQLMSSPYYCFLWGKKQIKNTYCNHFSRSYENGSIDCDENRINCFSLSSFLSQLVLVRFSLKVYWLHISS